MKYTKYACYAKNMHGACNVNSARCMTVIVDEPGAKS